MIDASSYLIVSNEVTDEFRNLVNDRYESDDYDIITFMPIMHTAAWGDSVVFRRLRLSRKSADSVQLPFDRHVRYNYYDNLSQARELRTISGLSKAAPPSLPAGSLP